MLIFAVLLASNTFNITVINAQTSTGQVTNQQGLTQGDGYQIACLGGQICTPEEALDFTLGFIQPAFLAIFGFTTVGQLGFIGRAVISTGADFQEEAKKRLLGLGISTGGFVLTLLVPYIVSILIPG